ncbi:MAG: cation/H(+) antiporter [Novosphingobium sp. 32-60-15]|uniref:cation:proton antiporter n=1 Tax=unclassified Novosphingobium TaxID=2644732 RepID=UPI000BD7D393|nr:MULTISPECIES: cation:proton antiporter [unclassified Novosphingobium]OYX61902.1 MAG: cation/H(+) antiporter [Novosphingobium sp. 32-60-15]
MTAAQASILFFLQMAAILATCRIIGWFAQRFMGQPQVVGEMIAGIVLGPSLLGMLLPEIEAALFPAESRKVLYVGAQLGVGLYMFIVGLTFDRAEFRLHARSSAAVSIGGMIAPFAVAALMIPWLLTHPGLFSPKVSSGQAALFLGSAIAITAFPMLARIIHERGIAGTRLGLLSLSAGAIGDAGAWAVIALVLASMGEGAATAIWAIGGGLAFAVVMIWIAPAQLKRLSTMAERSGAVDDGVLAIVLILFLLSAWAMDAAGIHAVFGGFLLGTAMPRGKFAEDLRSRLEPFTVVFLLPMFFTFSGLNTQLQVLGSASLLTVTLAILAASILAKGGACYLAARLSGQDHATSMGIGALMNARGLMELIIINIGLSRGIIGPALFAILVLMAIVTTLMATPLFELVYGRAARTRGDTRAAVTDVQGGA